MALAPLVENKLCGAKREAVGRLLEQSGQKMMVTWIKVLPVGMVRSIWVLDVLFYILFCFLDLDVFLTVASRAWLMVWSGTESKESRLTILK